MTTLGDVLNNRNIPTYRPPDGAQPAPTFVDDIGQTIQGMQRDSLTAQRAALAAAELRAAQLKLEADAEESQERLDNARAERALRRQPPPRQDGGGGESGEMINALITLVTETQKDTRNLMQQLTEKQNAELKAQLDSTRDQLTAAIQRPAEDPVASIGRYLDVFKALQEIAPKTEPANAAAQSVREIIELEKSRNQMEMDRMAFRLQFEGNEVEKQRIAADLQARQVRDWQMGKALQEAVPQLTAALTARITNSPWNPQLPVPPPNGLRSWICPGFPGTADQPPRPCNAENWDPGEATEAVCKTCGTGVRLEPLELPPPTLAPPPAAPALN